MMFSPKSPSSVLASTSRHNIVQHHQQQGHQKSLRLFLGDQSDDDAASDCDSYIGQANDNDSDDDRCTSGPSARLQPGRVSGPSPAGPSRARNSTRAYDDEEEGATGLFLASRPAKRPRDTSSPKKIAPIFSSMMIKKQAANSAAIPTTPTKRQKGFLVRGNVTPSKAFSIFKAAKKRSEQKQQHGLMTPPSSSPLRPIILDSCDDFIGRPEASPSRPHSEKTGISSSSTTRSINLIQSSPSRSAFAPLSSRVSSSAFKPSAFSGGSKACSSVAESLYALQTRRSGIHLAARSVSSIRASTVDNSAYLETFVSPSGCTYQLPRSADEDILSHPICAAYSYSSRAVNPSAQWLAVGDDEGRVTLINTLPWQDPSTTEPTEHPQWQASSSAAIFEVVWRFDDRALLTGASDFSIRSWDTEYQKCTGIFEGHRGSPRTIVYDPTTGGDGGCGMVFASAGRDGTVRIWDARCSEGKGDSDGLKPVLTIDAAHTTTNGIGSGPGGKARKLSKNGTISAARGRKKAQQPLPAGVTALSYLPDGEGHKLLSGGSANGIIKCWDLRHVRKQQHNKPVTEVDSSKTFDSPVSADWETPDLSLLSTPSTGLGSSRRAHGLSQIISSSTSLYASCTGGKIYALPLSTFLDSQLYSSQFETLYDPVQCQNTLFSRMALFDDRFLAVGCNTGNVALWDVSASSRWSGGRDGTAAEADVEEERRAARELETGFAYRGREGKRVAILTEGHVKNTEVNAVAWANGPEGPTLSSVGDDTNIRIWYADRRMRERITQVANE